MSRATMVAAALATGLALAWTGGAFAQAQSQTNGQPAAGGATTAPAPQTTTTQTTSTTPDYSPKPPPDNSDGRYLPSVVGGYLRSSTSCALVGCDNGPDVSGATPAAPPPNALPSGAPADAGAGGADR